jgi:hypothetical protein
VSIPDGFQEYDTGGGEKVSVMFKSFLHGFQFCIDIRIDQLLTALTGINLQCKTAFTFVVYCIVLCATGCDKVLHAGRQGSKRI